MQMRVRSDEGKSCEHKETFCLAARIVSSTDKFVYVNLYPIEDGEGDEKLSEGDRLKVQA